MTGNKRPEKKIFISYSHKDTTWKDLLRPHLGMLEREGRLSYWEDSQIETGEDWRAELGKALDEATAAVLLISADFLDSDFIMTEEVPRLLERRRRGELKIIPVVVRPCAWEKVSWLSSMQLFPKEGKPLSCFDENDVEIHLSDLAKKLSGPAAPGGQIGSGGPLKISIGKMPTSGKHLFGRKTELDLLTRAWDKADDKNPGIVILKAWGGVGKTALVNHWLNLMRDRSYAGAKHVYAWSFYSQGASEGKQASADEFFNETLQFFGEPVPQEEALSPVEKGKRLARLVKREKNLLILDGLEPLQYPPGELSGFDGELKDRGMRRFLKELAAGSPGLCVITTRVFVADVRDREGSGGKTIELEHLDESSGSELLKSLGTIGRPPELAEAVKEYGGHALALTLLGNYISRSFKGDIRKRDRIPSLVREKRQGRHAMRVMGAYEKWFGPKSVELDILRIMGLFDRPTEPGAVGALKKKPAIPGVTETVVDLPEEDWNEALSNLREAGLLAVSQQGDSAGQGDEILDCHPLVREYFANRLKNGNPEGWRKAHERLYEYYKAVPEKEQPDTLEEMEPLLAAVAHGCMAGKHQDVLDKVYYPRIRREGDIDYCCNMLGAFGSDLSALSHFFDRPWGQPVKGFLEDDNAELLNCAGIRLRALGRLHEAVQLMRTAVEKFTKQEDWEEAAINVSNLSELLLVLGRVAEAVGTARRAVTYSDQGGKWNFRRAERTSLADALNQAGQYLEAGKWFREAEDIQKESQPKYPFLYSLESYRYCDLLLDRGLFEEVKIRLDKLLEWRQPTDSILEIALENLTLGRALQLEAMQKKNDYTGGMPHLHEAVEGLRKASRLDYLPRGLFARASCFRLKGDFQNAEADLAEAYEIAQSGGMLLYYVDYHLESARLWKDQDNMEKAKQHRDEARKWMEETGYLRRKQEIEDIF